VTRIFEFGPFLKIFLLLECISLGTGGQGSQITLTVRGSQGNGNYLDGLEHFLEGCWHPRIVIYLRVATFP
jgi:hypothetical protein